MSRDKDYEAKARLMDSDSEEEIWSHKSKKKPSKIGCSSTEQQLVVVLIVCIFIILAMGVFLLYQQFKVKSMEQVCDTPNCVRTTGSLLTNMDLNADPCVDYYEYACGRYAEETTIPPEKSKFGSFNRVLVKNLATVKKLLDKEGAEYQGKNSTSIKKAKDYYKACMNTSRVDERGAAPLRKLLKDFGSWTVTSGDSGTWDESSWRLNDTLVLLHQHNIQSFFEMGVSMDSKNTSNNIIAFEQSGLTLDESNFYDGDSAKKLKKAYIDYFTQVGVLLGAKRADVNMVANEVYDFEYKLAKAFIPKEELLDPVQYYHKVPLRNLTETIGSMFSMKDYMRAMFGKEIPETELVLSYTPSYFTKMVAIVRSTPPRTLANYMMWNVVDASIGYLPVPFREAALILTNALSGVSALSPTWERCVAKTTDVVGFASSALFLEQHFTEKDKNLTENLVKRLREALIDNLPSVEWMDKTTRDRAKDKAEAIVQFIGYPDFVKNVDKLDEHYKELNVSDDEFFENMLRARRYGNRRNIKDYGKPPDKTRWSMKPTEVNAYYSSTSNKIVFPAGILQKPFYSSEFPMVINFGAMGMVVGHELTHGFDNRGRKFDKVGNMVNWWTNKSAEAYEVRSKCIEDQYSKYTILGKHVNGKTTLGENIADNGGVNIAFKAYEKWRSEQSGNQPVLPALNMTNNQLFYLGFAQVWCSYYTPTYAKNALVTDVHGPVKWRVNGVLSNNKDFAKAYKCAENSPMNPAKKCVVW
ncbi:unnamed protein product [Owenia fusiformis]|uniref:Uncharacterized protein n=1 Tax=Owenia fusiformis TaxID=6347 RepID=A0A8J1TRZ7_OWEFU|nr:unnamed protein product [Owenia fusiformis]